MTTADLLRENRELYKQVEKIQGKRALALWMNDTFRRILKAHESNRIVDAVNRMFVCKNRMTCGVRMSTAPEKCPTCKEFRKITHRKRGKK